MKFGVMLPHYRQMAGTEAIARVALEAEDMGYDSVWVSDHIVVPDEDVERFGKGYYDLFSVLAYVAAITQRVSLGTSIFIIPLRNPLHAAQIAATVDQLSGGRLILGVGAGSAEPEYQAMGVPWNERGAIFDEALSVLKHVWTVDSPNFQGSYFNFSGINSFPQPMQQPHPPLWVGGGSRRSIRRAAEFGDAWHPTRPSFQLLEEGIPRLRRLAERAGRDPDSIQIAARHPMKIMERTPAPTTATAPSVGAPAVWPLVDTAERVAETVNRFQEAGVSHLVMDTFYSIPELHQETVDSVLVTMERFAQNVISQFDRD